MNRTVRTLTTAALAALTLTACKLPDEFTLEDPYSRETTAATPDARNALDVLGQLTVAPEDTGNHYDRDDWPHWSSAGDGCNTRQAVLINEGHDIERVKDCKITTGEWISAYDDITVTNSGELDIDHIVPLAEVARSGSRNWTRGEREEYANDFEVLIAVTSKSNRSKGDQDPAEWMPPADAFRCTYAARWVSTKSAYSLTVDPAERDALASVLTNC